MPPRAQAADECLVWTPKHREVLLAAVDHGDTDLAQLAYAWLVQPPRGRRPAARPQLAEPSRTAAQLGRRLAELRRMDDLVGGRDLAGVVEDELRAGLALLPASRQGRERRRMLTVVAGLAQLAGWTMADAGLPGRALRAYELALSAAGAGGDLILAGHVLGCVSHLVALGGNPQEALLLARTAHAATRGRGAAALQVLLLHRIALAAALAGERRASEEALAAAERLADRRDPGHEPSWLYWLDEDELAAMSARCFTALGRPLRAEPVLRTRLGKPVGPRTRALDGGWLAQAYLDAGELDHACAVAGLAVLAAVRSGSVRAATRALAPRTRLLGSGGGSPARDYAALVRAVRPYLPGGAHVARRASG
jgi:hypothetical protein